MTTIFAIIILVFFPIIYLRKMHNSCGEIKFKFKLFKLRDELRMLAINEKIDKESSVFKYIDFTFSRIINTSYDISLFYLLCLNMKHPRDKENIETYEALFVDINKSKELSNIMNEFSNAISEYVKEQHYITFTIFIKPIARLILGKNTAANRFQDINQSSLYLPETSAVQKYPISLQSQNGYYAMN